VKVVMLCTLAVAGDAFGLLKLACTGLGFAALSLKLFQVTNPTLMTGCVGHVFSYSIRVRKSEPGTCNCST
jgi:hypothetical protein